MSGKSYAAWANIVLIPAKQHFFCCGVLPVAVSALGGAGAAEFLHTPEAEITMALVVPPVVTYGVMLAEQKYHDYKARRRAKKTTHMHDHEKTDCAADNASCACEHKVLTRKNFLKQTALGYAFYAAAYMVLPSHDHAHCDHDHDHHHNHPHLHEQQHEHHEGCDHNHDHTHDNDKAVYFWKRNTLAL